MTVRFRRLLIDTGTGPDFPVRVSCPVSMMRTCCSCVARYPETDASSALARAGSSRHADDSTAATAPAR